MEIKRAFVIFSVHFSAIVNIKIQKSITGRYIGPAVRKFLFADVCVWQARQWVHRMLRCDWIAGFQSAKQKDSSPREESELIYIIFPLI